MILDHKGNKVKPTEKPKQVHKFGKFVIPKGVHIKGLVDVVSDDNADKRPMTRDSML